MALKVLTVDDSKTIRTIVKKAFKPYDCEMFEAENGVEGLASAAKVHPDLIVLDLTMPVMNGIEMLEKMRVEASLKDIPVIMLTAESGRENVIKIVKMGVKDYIVKPFKGEQLIERATKILTLEPKKDETASGADLSRYFSVDGEFDVMAIPEKLNKSEQAELEGMLQSKCQEMKKNGRGKIVFDLKSAPAMNVSIIKLLIALVGISEKSGFQYQVLASDSVQKEMKGLAELSNVPVAAGMEEIKSGS